MWLGVKPRFFDTMGIPIVAGRPFRDGEWPPANGSLAVLSASLATRLFGGADAAVGQRVTGIGGNREVIGVAGDVTQHSLRDAQAWIIYVPVIPRVSVTSSIVLRTSVDPAPLAPAVRAAVREYSTQFEVRDWRTYGDIREASIVTERLLARLATVFAALAALLAAVGIYGVVAYTMAQRTPEIGLRMALGADARDVIRLVVGRVLGLTAVGAAMGLLGAWAGTRLVAGLLFGVSPADPATLGAALLLLACVAGIASYLPARRAASRIDPAVVLRGD
jgi:putative ABC transport system permease protein